MPVMSSFCVTARLMMARLTAAELWVSLTRLFKALMNTVLCSMTGYIAVENVPASCAPGSANTWKGASPSDGLLFSKSPIQRETGAVTYT